MGKNIRIAAGFFFFFLPFLLYAQEPAEGRGKDGQSPPAAASSSLSGEKAPAGDAEAPDGKGIYLKAQSEDIRILLQQLSHMEKVNIVATGDVQGTVSINLYGATLEEALEAVLVPNGFSCVRRGNFIYVMKKEAVDAFSSKPRDTVVRIYKLSYLSIPDAKELLSLYLSKDGEIKTGKESKSGITTGESETGGETNATNNVIVVKDYPEIQDKIAAALKDLDSRPRQVLVEATIIEVTLDETSRLGVDFNKLGGVDYSELGAKSNLLGISGAEADGSLIKEGFTTFGTRGFTSADNSEGFSIGILKDDLSFFFDALQKVTDTNVLANPKVLALNRQRAEIIIGGRLGYFGSETLSEGGFSQQEVEFLDTGTQLRFRPFIGHDQFIRMEIHPQRSDGVVDSVTGLPSETTSEVTTNVMVKDGDTIVIGGLIETRDTKTITEVPFLGDIPVIGWLFRKVETGTKRVEIVILITPHIVDPDVTNDDAEILRAGYEVKKRSFRAGFPQYVRAVQSERHLEEARRALDGGKLSLAAFHLGWAESLDPHRDAIYEMKAELNALRKRSGSRDVRLENYIWNQVK